LRLEKSSSDLLPREPHHLVLQPSCGCRFQEIESPLQEGSNSFSLSKSIEKTRRERRRIYDFMTLYEYMSMRYFDRAQEGEVCKVDPKDW